MDNEEVFYTNEIGVSHWESGEIFIATPNESQKNNIRFTVSSQFVIERNNIYVVIDTGNDADL